ncbi:hypothetical protein STENM223S_11006 [Streptomyces tendae]
MVRRRVHGARPARVRLVLGREVGGGVLVDGVLLLAHVLSRIHAVVACGVRRAEDRRTPTDRVPRRRPTIPAAAQSVRTCRVVNPMAVATAASTATLVRAAGRLYQSAMKPMAGGPSSIPP